MKKLYCISLSLLFIVTNSIYAQIDSTSFIYKRPLFDFNELKPIFKLTNEQLINKKRFLRFYALTGYREGVEPINDLANFAGNTDTVQGIRRIYMFNLSIQDILTHGLVRQERIILEVKDPSKYRYLPEYGAKEVWIMRHTYCFELALPVEVVKDIKPVNQLLSDLFRVKFGYQKRKINALILTRTSNLDKIKSDRTSQRIDGINGVFKNTSISFLGKELSNAGIFGFIDESGYNDMVDLDLNIIDYSDIDKLRKSLQRYDLDLKEEERELDFFVIHEL